MRRLPRGVLLLDLDVALRRPERLGPAAFERTPHAPYASIHAELFELSADGTKWNLVEPRLLYVTVHTSAIDDSTRINATTAAGRSVVDSRLNAGSKVERISECFVFWRDKAGRTLAVNTLSNRDASAFVAAASPLETVHSSAAGLFQIALFDGTRVISKPGPVDPTVVAVNPLTLAFHYDHQLINVDLLECVVCRGASDREIHLGHGTAIYQFEFEQSACSFLEQILNLSSLLLARTTSSEVALTYLQRQRAKIHDRINALRAAPSSLATDLSEERALLKDAVLRTRISALQRAHIPGFDSLSALLGPRALSYAQLESPLPAAFICFANLHNFRLWRKPADGRVTDLRVLSSHRETTLMTTSMAQSPSRELPPNEMILSCAPSTSQAKITPIVLPNGETTMVAHDGDSIDQLLARTCEKLNIEDNLFELTRNEHGMMCLRLKLEYEIEKRDGKLGLTIFANTDENGVIKAQVRHVAKYVPCGASIGDWVTAVDGVPIENVPSASGVEHLLREGRRIRLLRQNLAREFDLSAYRRKAPATRSVSVPAPLPSSRLPLEDRLHKGLQELLSTERKYVDELKQMVDAYLSIRSVRETMESALRLEKIQEAFLEGLEEAIGDADKEHVSKEQVRIYAEYAAAYLRLQQELASRKDVLAELEAANYTGAQHCSYESRMIKPVQRVVQYPLLLRTVAAGCERNSLEARQVETALQKMQTLAEYVNEMQRIHEQFSPQIDSVKKANADMLKEKSLRIDVRELLIFAHIRWLNSDPKASQEYVIFVFSSLILLLPSSPKVNFKPKHCRLLPVVEVEVGEGRSRDGSVHPSDGLLTLIHVGDQNPPRSAAEAAARVMTASQHEANVYRIACCQPLLKQQLVKSIRRARTTYMKETKRPLSGSSQSDAGYASEHSKDLPTSNVV